MTVEDMIEALRKLPAEHQVRIYEDGTGQDEPVFAVKETGPVGDEYVAIRA